MRMIWTLSCVGLVLLGSVASARSFVDTFQASFKTSKTSLSQPVLDRDLLRAQAFAKDAVLSLYTLGHGAESVDISVDLARSSHFFSPQVWQAYLKDFHASGNGRVMAQDGLSVTARLDGQLQVAEVKRGGASARWIDVTVPLVATYRGYDYKVRQFLEAKVRVALQPKAQAQRDASIIGLTLHRRSPQDEKTLYDRSRPGCPLDARH
jgi:hypothetical protein